MKYYPAKYFTYDLLQKYVKSCGELAIIKNAPYLARMKEQAHIRRYFIEIAEKNANYTIKHIDELPKNISVRNYIRNLHCHYTKSIDPSGAQTIYGNIIIIRVKKRVKL